MISSCTHIYHQRFPIAPDLQSIRVYSFTLMDINWFFLVNRTNTSRRTLHLCIYQKVHNYLLQKALRIENINDGISTCLTTCFVIDLCLQTQLNLWVRFNGHTYLNRNSCDQFINHTESMINVYINNRYNFQEQILQS